MAGVVITQNSFAAGELAPFLWGRKDIARYRIGLAKCKNWIVERSGSIANRAGTLFTAATKLGIASVSRIVPMVRDASNVYVLEFGESYLRVYKNDALQADIVSPYAAADLAGLQLAQSVDVVTITHPSYAPRKLSRTSDVSWAFSTPSFTPTLNPPAAGFSLTPGRGAALTPLSPAAVAAVGGNVALPFDRYEITSGVIGAGATGISAVATSTVGGADGANHVVITWTGTADSFSIYKYIAGQFQRIGSVAGSIHTFTDTGLGADSSPPAIAPTFVTNLITFSYAVTTIADADASESVASAIQSCQGLEPTQVNPNNLSWTAVVGAREYNVYRENNGVYGYVGTARGSGTLTFLDPITPGAAASTAPDSTVRPPVNRTTFSASGDYPSAVAYFQQRLCFAGSNNKPEWAWLSATGSFLYFADETPITNSSPVSFQLNSLQITPIRWMIDLGKLVIFTGNAVFTLDGNGDGLVTPTAINARLVNSIGCSATLRPLVINNTALYVQAIGNVVRDLRFDLQTEGYNGDDVSVWGAHLLQGHTIKAWAYAEIPNSTVWIARDDGVLVAVTYIPSQSEQIIAWHQHDVGGVVEDVCVIPGALEHQVYLIVRRTVNGTAVRYIERLASRLVTDVAVDAHFLDCGKVIDGRNLGTTTMELNAGSTWLAGESLSLLASTNAFQVGAHPDFGDTVRVRIGSVFCTALVTSHNPLTPTNVATVTLINDCPLALQNAPTLDWATQRTVFVGLGHLAGDTVSALADGNVYTDLVVSNTGSVTLPNLAEVVHVGYPIDEADVTTLPPEIQAPGQTLAGRTRTIQKITALIDATRGLTYGEDFDHLEEPAERSDENYDTAARLISAEQDVEPQSTWNRTGQACIRQESPLPARLLSLALHLSAGDA